MGYVIAIAGKGGTGKTTIAALIVRIIKEKKLGSVLAVDADPSSNLAEALGLKTGRTIGNILDGMAKQPSSIPQGMTKDRFIEYQVQTAVDEGGGFDVLTMGAPEGPGCYCYVNNSLRSVMQKLIDDYDYIVIDNEAGLEHLSRRTSRYADTLLVVSDATIVGLRAARKINELSRELEIDIKKRLLIVNRFDGAAQQVSLMDTGLQHIGNVAFDEDIASISLNGVSLFSLKEDALSLATLRKIGDSIWQR